MKKRIFAAAVITICLAIAGYGTLAFFTDEVVAHNVITSGGVAVEIHETTDKIDPVTGEAKPFEDVSGVMPGVSVSKIVQTKNTGANDAWVRVWVNVGISEPGNPILNPMIKNLPLTIQDAQGNVIDVIQMDFDLGDGADQWTLGEDYYYYYNSSLAPGELTAPLFENVKFAPEMDNTYQNCKVMIDIIAEAVQVANNPIPEGGDVTDIKGWPNT